MTRNEAMLWWKVALHIDEAQLALANAMSQNGDDPRLIYALQERLREVQAFLLGIFGEKGLLPTMAAPPMTRPPVSRSAPPPAAHPAAPPSVVVAPMSPDQLKASLEQPSASWIPDEPEAEAEASAAAPAIETPAVEVVEAAKETPLATTANGASSAPIEVPVTVIPTAETEV